MTKPRHSPSVLRGIIVSRAIVAGLSVLMLVGVFLVLTRHQHGNLIMGDHAEAGLHDVVKLTLEANARLTQAIMAVFAAVAFLVTYQQKGGLSITLRAWTFLSIGVIFLVAALTFSLLANEVILAMIAKNAVDLTIPALRFARWSLYSTCVLASVMMGLFALEIAVRGAHPEESSSMMNEGEATEVPTKEKRGAS